VSSLATHVTCRIEADAAHWAGDASGEAFVSRLNTFLPPHVRVFAAATTPRSFEARAMCTERAYTYLLPLRALTLDAPPAEEGAVGAPRAPPCAPDAPLTLQRVAALDAALALFEGTHAFHNFTQRKRYAPPPSAGAARAHALPAAAAAAAAAADVEADADGEEEEEAKAEEAPSAAPSVGAPAGVVGVFAPGGTYWHASSDARDRVGNAHFRRVTRCRAARDTEVCPLSGEPFIRIHVEGESFMLHQIRKMVATAVAVARGALPAAFIPAALARPCRARTPMAPPATLLLSGASFRAFKPDTSNGGVNAGVERRLATPPHVQADVDAWAARVLLPALAPALADASWEEFLRNLDAMCPQADHLPPVLAAAAAYRMQADAAKPPRAERERARSGAAEQEG
jgi:tRNA pseudouridine38-40 synthase